MAGITILGVEFPDVDFRDEKTALALEQACNKVGDMPQPKNNRAKLIGWECDVASLLLNDVLGDGAADKVFKGARNGSMAETAINNLFEAVQVSDKESENNWNALSELVNGYTAGSGQNREQRREQERQKHKKKGRKNSHYQATSPASAPLHVVPEPYAPESQPAPEQTE